MAISEGLRSQIRGLGQAVRNSNDGLSVVGTAEGSLEESTNILQRLRELAVQAANDTNSASNRASLQSEIDQLVAELNRIASTVQFNGLNLLDGSFVNKSFQVGAFQNQTISFSIGDFRASSLGQVAQVNSTAVQGALTLGQLALNGSQIAATTTDSVSFAQATGSAIAVANAINLNTAAHSVTAEANSTTVSAQVLTASQQTTTVSGLSAGDLTLNSIGIRATVAGDDTVSTQDNATSAIAVAAAINDATAQTGVTATVDANTRDSVTTATFNSTEVGVAFTSANDLVLNGTNVGTTSADAFGDADSAIAIATAINAGSSGVTATVNAATTDFVVDTFVSTATDAVAGGGDLVINGVNVAASVADGVSNESDTASALSVAAAITGTAGLGSGNGGVVTATANANVVTAADAMTAFTTTGAGEIIINGTDLHTAAGGPAVTEANIVDVINGVIGAGVTGVTASLNGGALVLTAADGRNIDIETTGAIGGGGENTGDALGFVGVGLNINQNFTGTVTLTTTDNSEITLTGTDDTLGFGTVSAGAGTSKVDAVTLNDTNTLTINGTQIGTNATPITVLLGDTDNALITAINNEAATTGVTASVVGGELVLTSADGRNIDVVTAGGTGSAGTGFLLGLADNVASGDNGNITQTDRGSVSLSSASPFSITVNVANTGFSNQSSVGGIQALTLNDTTSLFINDTQIGTNAAPVVVTAGDTSGSLVAAINAETGTTGVSASVVNGQLVLSAADGRNIEIDTVGANTAFLLGLSTQGTVLTDDVDTGTLTLSATASFTIAGNTPGNAGLTAGTSNVIGDIDAVSIDGTTNSLVINGVNLGAIAVDAGDGSGSLVATINLRTNDTGVVASVTNGQLSLTAADGRNITLTTTGTVGGALGLTADNATNLAASTTSGTITLRSSSDFSIGGSNSAQAGLTNQVVARDPSSAVVNVSVTTTAAATAAIRTVDFALDQISTLRSSLGALSNRLESTIRNLQTVSENLQASDSRIRDVDFASETAALIRAQILQQASVAILAQANVAPQLALSLLG